MDEVNRDDLLLNDFGHQCFFEIADGDYIAARMASRAGLLSQFLWASQQAVEKYLKYVLLINRVPARDVFHDLGKAVSKINASGKLKLDLTDVSSRFIERLDQVGEYRYFEVSQFKLGRDLVILDITVWELRRYCTLAPEPRSAKLRQGCVAPRIHIQNGYLERVIDDKADPAHEPLLWQNGYFGRQRKTVKVKGGFEARNAPLFLSPHILDEVLKYVYLPKGIAAAYREHGASRELAGATIKPRQETKP